MTRYSFSTEKTLPDDREAQRSGAHREEGKRLYVLVTRKVSAKNDTKGEKSPLSTCAFFALFGRPRGPLDQPEPLPAPVLPIFGWLDHLMAGFTQTSSGWVRNG